MPILPVISSQSEDRTVKNAPYQSIEEGLRLAREEQADAFAALEARVARAKEVMEGPRDCSTEDLAVAAETLAIYGDVVRASRAEEVIRVLALMSRTKKSVDAAVAAQQASSSGLFGMLTLEHVLLGLIGLTSAYVVAGGAVALLAKAFN